MANGAIEESGWMNDVQKTLAYFITVSFVLLIFVWIFKPPVMAAESMAQLNALVSTLQNVLLMSFGFFLGANMSSKLKDESQNRMLDKLTPPAAPLTAVPPAPSTLVPPWWARLDDAEKNAITAASAADPRVNAFVTASQVGAATVDDLNYLVSKGLLTQDRATAIAAP